jgi:hypothetical protein
MLHEIRKSTHMRVCHEATTTRKYDYKVMSREMKVGDLVLKRSSELRATNLVPIGKDSITTKRSLMNEGSRCSLEHEMSRTPHIILVKFLRF